MLDVKVGAGAFMREVEEARALAQIMVDIGVSAGRQMVALLSDMDQPLGEAVGNALEVREAVETLRGGGPADLREHCLTIAAHMLRLGRQDTASDGLERALDDLGALLASGAGLNKLRELVEAQGGDVRAIDDPNLLPQAHLHEVISAPRGGWVARVDALRVAQATLELGAGREKKRTPSTRRSAWWPTARSATGSRLARLSSRSTPTRKGGLSARGRNLIRRWT